MNYLNTHYTIKKILKNAVIHKLHSANLIRLDPMMRCTERKLEKKRKNEGGSNGENLRELEKKRNCPFDAKKVCPVTRIVFGQGSIASDL